MKTFLRKLKLSFLAMLCGWIACNIALWIAYGIVMLVEGEQVIESFRLNVVMVFAALTGLWIAAVWLVIFLPVDLMIADSSRLRRPKTAALMGLASAVLFVACYLLCMAAISGSPLDTSAALVFGTFGLGASVTGSFAAFVRSLMDRKLHSLKP